MRARRRLLPPPALRLRTRSLPTTKRTNAPSLTAVTSAPGHSLRLAPTRNQSPDELGVLAMRPAIAVSVTTVSRRVSMIGPTKRGVTAQRTAPRDRRRSSSTARSAARIRTSRVTVPPPRSPTTPRSSATPGGVLPGVAGDGHATSEVLGPCGEHGEVGGDVVAVGEGEGRECDQHACNPEGDLPGDSHARNQGWGERSRTKPFSEPSSTHSRSATRT